LAARSPKENHYVRIPRRREPRYGRAQEGQDAQQRWGFITNFNLSTIKNEVQLSSMVKDRSGISEAQAKNDVQAWIRGKQF
jgi:hypothetical protein